MAESTILRTTMDAESDRSALHCSVIVGVRDGRTIVIGARSGSMHLTEQCSTNLGYGTWGVHGCVPDMLMLCGSRNLWKQLSGLRCFSWGLSMWSVKHSRVPTCRLQTNEVR